MKWGTVPRITIHKANWRFSSVGSNNGKMVAHISWPPGALEYIKVLCLRVRWRTSTDEWPDIACQSYTFIPAEHISSSNITYTLKTMSRVKKML